MDKELTKKSIRLKHMYLFFTIAFTTFCAYDFFQSTDMNTVALILISCCSFALSYFFGNWILKRKPMAHSKLEGAIAMFCGLGVAGAIIYFDVVWQINDLLYNLPLLIYFLVQAVFTILSENRHKVKIYVTSDDVIYLDNDES